MSNLRTYILGFVSSLVLTSAAFFAVYTHTHSGHIKFSHPVLIMAVLVLAVLQLLVQLFLFIHLGREQKPRYNATTFIITTGLVLILVVASLWIMSHLNYNMTPDQMNEYIQKSESF